MAEKWFDMDDITCGRRTLVSRTCSSKDRRLPLPATARLNSQWNRFMGQRPIRLFLRVKVAKTQSRNFFDLGILRHDHLLKSFHTVDAQWISGGDLAGRRIGLEFAPFILWQRKGIECAFARDLNFK